METASSTDTGTAEGHSETLGPLTRGCWAQRALIVKLFVKLSKFGINFGLSSFRRLGMKGCLGRGSQVDN